MIDAALAQRATCDPRSPVLKEADRRCLPSAVRGTWLPGSIGRYCSYLRDWFRYASMGGAERLHWLDRHPCLHDATSVTPFDSHYFYQDIWAFKAIRDADPSTHIDVGSRAILVGMLSAVTNVTFVDIRPLRAKLANLECKEGTLLGLPFDDGAVSSMSCLHVAEHVGLGRYGDDLDPHGTVRATRELSRVLAPGGRLYFSLPIGRPRVCFNAHRIHAPAQILDYFSDLKLESFAGISDRGDFLPDADPHDFAEAKYACGLFQFTKQC